MAWTTEPIETERLILRPADEGDKPALAELLSDELVRAYLGGPVAPHVVAALGDATVGERWGSFVIADKTNTCLGTIRLHDDRGEWELSYELSPEHWGKGLATEAGTATLHWAWANIDDASIIAVTQKRNRASIRLLTRLGFEPDGKFVEFEARQSRYRVKRS